MKKIILLSFISLFSYYKTSFSYTVIYNTKTHIYHNPNCKHAKRCIKNCVNIDINEIYNKGRACKICRG